MPTSRPYTGAFLAPGRVNLIGEHLDYNGGRCLPIALRNGCRTSLTLRTDDRVSLASAQAGPAWQGRLEDCASATGWAAYPAGVLWALRQDGIDLPGMDLEVNSDVPPGAGLSSSAALECSVALAAAAAAGLPDTPGVRERLLAACVRAENEVVRAPTGGMDQAVALFAEPDHALLLDFARGARRRVRWDPGAHELELVVVNTGVQHALADGSYGDRRAECERAANALDAGRLASVTDLATALARIDDAVLRRRVRHVLTEQDRVGGVVRALEAEDLRMVGPLLTASHTSLRDDFEVSCPELDAVVDTALAHGAEGARMTGGGFGGSAIVLARTERVAAVRAAVTAAFAAEGWSAPTFLDGAAGAAASRVDPARPS